LRRRTTAAQEAADASSRCRLNQSPPPGAGGSQLDEGIEGFVVHAVAPFGVLRHQIIIHSGRRAVVIRFYLRAEASQT
jgi:hypothetical protein